MAKRRILDYGGVHAQTGKPGSEDQRDKNSYRCNDCNSLQYATIQQATRSALLHCVHCGGSLEETESSRQRRLEREKRIFEKQDSAQVKTM